MNKFLLLSAPALLVSCNSDRSPPADKASEGLSAGATAVPGSTPTGTMSLLNTTWEFSDDGEPTVITIDNSGAYIENRADGSHVDHGTYTQRDGKDCFSSAMADEGTSCWTAVPEVGTNETASATSDNGETAVFKRVEYRALALSG